MFISESNLAALTSTSIATVRGWGDKGVYPSLRNKDGIMGFNMEDLANIPEINAMLNNTWDEEIKTKPIRNFTSVELFAGAGGLALGLEKAGFKHILLNEFDTSACNTLRINRPEWNIIEGDVRHIDFTPLYRKVDFLSGGFPCQAFSFAGKQGGFNDVRGTLFFELARAVKEIEPKVFLCENVKGLTSHDNGKTFKTICNIISELGYTLIPPRILKGIMYQVPQKRERIILIAIRNDLAKHVTFNWPSPYKEILCLRDALFKSVIFDSDVPESEGATYPSKKKSVLDLVPPGGDWRDLPENIAKDYMGGSWFLGGGKTGMARRLSLDEPSLTLTCSPAQKQTERCHPLHTRPLSIREYARIQTFPDDWVFHGTMSDKYKQIGNAVPVNLSWAIGRALIRLFNDIETIYPSKTADWNNAIRKIINKQASLTTIKDKKTQTSSLVTEYPQLSLFDLFNEYTDSPIMENLVVSESQFKYTTTNNIELQPESKNKNVLIALIKPDHQKEFNNKSATIYYTGKRFPASVKIKELFFFMPYIKGKGIRDLYIIKKVRIGKYIHNKKTEYRMVFDLEFVCPYFEDFQMVNLNIWRTYIDSTIADITHLISTKKKIQSNV